MLLIVILGIVALIIVIFLSYLIWSVLAFKYKVIIREMTNGQELLIPGETARDYVDSEGVNWWRLKNEKDKIKRKMPVPPSEAINLTKGGKKIVEAIRLETGEYFFLKNGVKVELPPKDMFGNPPKDITSIKDNTEREKKLSEWRKKLLADWVKKNNVVENFQPLTTNQRVILTNEIRKAEVKRGKSWKENLPVYVSLMALVIIVIALMVFWGDLAKPVLDAKGMDLENAKIHRETMEIIKQIDLRIQNIEAQTTANGGAPQTTPPN